MAGPNESLAAPSSHVPAWKRLGLQLKYAKDTAEPSKPLHHASSPPAKDTAPQRTPTVVENDRPSKKRKTSPAPAVPLEKAAQGADSSLKTRPEQAAPSPAVDDSAVRASVETTSVQQERGSNPAARQDKSKDSRPAKVKRRKSVTFTEGTKVEDGASAAATAEASQSDSTAASTSPDTLPSESPAKPKRSKRERSSQDGQTTFSTGANGAIAVSPTNPPEYLRYLEQFRSDRSSWKFNKNHQSALLKHCFDVRKVPPSSNSALAAYISGLKGAGPQQRLREGAIEILRKFAEKDGSLETIDEMNTASARRQAYMQALRRQLQIWEDAGMPRSEYDDNEIEDMNAELERGKRAEAVLLALPLSEPDTATDMSSTTASSHATNQKAEPSTDTSQAKAGSKQKRKRRVEVSSDSSSSDPDSSSSDDEPAAPARRADEAPSVSKSLRPSKVPSPNPKTEHNRTPAYQHDNLNMAYRPQNPSQLMNANVKPTKKFFDDELLDAAFPKKKTYSETAPKRRRVDGGKARGFAYTHGTRVDESESEDE